VPWSVTAGSVGDKVATGHVFLRALLLSPVSIISPLLRIHSRITWGMDKGSVSNRSSTETKFRPTVTIVVVVVVAGSNNRSTEK
jgi:hypothetical protein